MSITTRSAGTRSAAYQVLERIFDEGFATGNDAIVDEVCAPDLIEHQFGTAGQGREAIEQGDTIWVRTRGHGTATGPFFGPPSGRPVDFTVIDVARVADGRITEHWGVPDRFAMLAQTGILDRLA